MVWLLDGNGFVLMLDGKCVGVELGEKVGLVLEAKDRNR
jgi:hypothetical protein